LPYWRSASATSFSFALICGLYASLAGLIISACIFHISVMGMPPLAAAALVVMIFFFISSDAVFPSEAAIALDE
jgi:hypothetical protein